MPQVSCIPLEPRVAQPLPSAAPEVAAFGAGALLSLYPAQTAQLCLQRWIFGESLSLPMQMQICLRDPWQIPLFAGAHEPGSLRFHIPPGSGTRCFAASSFFLWLGGRKGLWQEDVLIYVLSSNIGYLGIGDRSRHRAVQGGSGGLQSVWQPAVILRGLSAYP